MELIKSRDHIPQSYKERKRVSQYETYHHL